MSIMGGTSYELDTISENLNTFYKIQDELQNLKDEIQKNIEVLRPQWTTTGGQKTIALLDDFFKVDYKQIPLFMNQMTEAYKIVQGSFENIDRLR